ncbi:YD repeat-containing protein [Dyadobacter soli]|uniref:YD repeat-containing protein n=1 Tax=Dyadobacter soli TaxID=659014 RepID=A0A1G7IQN8_9BACT|nr:hypothetical protein [Dyadobacter soli]SDF14864.1 YD repeat-containing protein [Dyadobacter soli]
MRVSPRFIIYLSLFAFLLSCKNSEPETKTTCLFTGKTSIFEYQAAHHRKVTNTIEYDQDAEKRLKTAGKTLVDEASEGTEFVSKTTDATVYSFTYDNEGFLTTMVTRRSILFEGSEKETYYYFDKLYKNFRLDNIETAVFSYTNGRVATVSFKNVNTTKGDNDNPIVLNTERSKKYEYSGDNVVSALLTAVSGNTLTSFSGGKITSIQQTDDRGNEGSLTTYNAQGLAATVTLGPSRSERKYDANENLISIQHWDRGTLTTHEEYEYDNHENPEYHIPRYFKGIPDPIVTVQSTQGANNLLFQRTKNSQSNITFENRANYQYNAYGLPESVVLTPVSAPSNPISSTTFRYKCP